MHNLVAILITLIAFGSAGVGAQSTDTAVIADGAIEISRAELAAVLAETPDTILLPAARDLGDRFAFLNQLVVDRKLAAEADELGPDDAGYWKLKAQLDGVKRDFMFRRHLASYEVPPLDALVRERYEAQKDKYALIPETRASSHILFMSPPGRDRAELREKARKVLAELRGGADFEAYVEEYSQDPGSAARDGSLDRWLRFGDPEITPPYTEALFAIEKVGGYSDVTDSEFGLHIIRLDGVRKAGYKSVEEARPAIVADLVTEYRKLARKDIRSRYDISDDAFIDGDAMEALFGPYKP